ncbi:hypothetical protein JKF63_05281 [Porcisia hertigi]|uniref:Uncharacterized protein n=1 Tax=Porcisia hertigi TaxID=2761500 RepID=A0A836IYX0_9TRYP|nr:hypothetical protein JKF63_05281 [Porcisia hertigi]
MFRGHWIFADMDGTLTPTPTRAHGKYLPLSHCMQTELGCRTRYKSCLPWLRLFLERGGSLCVVTTAGQRMWSQLYPDLAPALFRLRAAAAVSSASADERSFAPPGSSPPMSSSVAPGALYLCGFTGAALFRSRPWQEVWLDMDRLHPHWRVPSRPPDPSSPSGDENLQSGETAVAEAMVPPAGVGLEEWTEYREQGAAREAASTPATPNNRSATMDAAACRLARREGRQALVRFFEHASYICGHNATRARDFFAACLSTKYHSVFADLLQQLLAEVHACAPPEDNATCSAPTDRPYVCFSESKVLSSTALAQHGFFLHETGDALVDAQVVPRADGTVADGAPVAQVVVMGIPMRFFEHVFPAMDDGASSSKTPPGSPRSWHCCPRCAAAGAGARQRLEAAGLEVKSQPNSVCLHRRGVDKATCVRWFLDQNERHQLKLELAQALAFGDMPESVDAPLTNFFPMRFISVSPKGDSVARLADINRPAAFCSTSSHIDGAPGERQPPPHDHLSDNAHSILHVGGEEEGTALFLEELFTSCTSEQMQDQQRGAGSSPSVSGEAAPVVNWFTADRVAACAFRARRHVEREILQRQKLQTTTDSKKAVPTAL